MPKKPILNRCLKVSSIYNLVEISAILFDNLVPYRLEFDVMDVEGDICPDSEYVVDADGCALYAEIYANFSSLEEAERVTTRMVKEGLIARRDN